MSKDQSASFLTRALAASPPDPAARALLALVADDPDRAFKVLAA